jgi:hypothetical protein
VQLKLQKKLKTELSSVRPKYKTGCVLKLRGKLTEEFILSCLRFATKTNIYSLIPLKFKKSKLIAERNVTKFSQFFFQSDFLGI